MQTIGLYSFHAGTKLIQFLNEHVPSVEHQDDLFHFRLAVMYTAGAMCILGGIIYAGVALNSERKSLLASTPQN